jgi:hypothetical protein
MTEVARQLVSPSQSHRTLFEIAVVSSEQAFRLLVFLTARGQDICASLETDASDTVAKRGGIYYAARSSVQVNTVQGDNINPDFSLHFDL